MDIEGQKAARMLLKVLHNYLREWVSKEAQGEKAK